MSRRAMGVYVQASTANPTGWRPWNSRLGFYLPNSFPLPTTGRGPWLLQPGAPCAKPAAAGGLGAVDFPNYAGFGGPRNWISRVQSWVPSPVYGPPPSVRMRLTGLGATNNVRLRRSPTAVISSSTPAQTWRSQQQNNQNQNRRNRWQQQNQSSNYEGWSSGQQPQSYQQWQQQQAQTGSLSSSAAGSIVGYDASGNPIYSSPPAGMSVVGTDAQGNPIYGTAGSTTSAAATTPSSTGTSILTEDSLGLGLPNWMYAGIGLGLVLIFKRR